MNLFRSLSQQDYWHGESNIGPNITPGKLGGYYSDLRQKTFVSTERNSTEGVPLIKYQGKFLMQPVTVCQVALGWHERWLDDSSDVALGKFLQLADWLVENSKYRDNIGYVWPMQYGIALYSLDPGWISALVQGQAISVLVRAFNITKRDPYLRVAQGAIEPFNISIYSGGVRFENEGGDLFFEEYPSLKEIHVLNGYISSLWGLYDYYVCTKVESVRNLFLQGINSLLNTIDLFDTGYWSRYSLLEHRVFSNFASPYYHRAHISQLRATNTIHENKILLEYADKWEGYLGNRTSLYRVILKKGVSRVWFTLNEKYTSKA